MEHIPQYLSGMNVFINGVGLLGVAKMLTLPKVEQMRETASIGGFERSLSTGVFKAMEAEITISEYSPLIYQHANLLGGSPLFVAKGNLVQKGKNAPVIATLKGTVDVDDGNWESGKQTERKIKVYVDFYSLFINNIEQVLLDTDNLIARVGSVDVFDKLRSNIL